MEDIEDRSQNQQEEHATEEHAKAAPLAVEGISEKPAKASESHSPRSPCSLRSPWQPQKPQSRQSSGESDSPPSPKREDVSASSRSRKSDSAVVVAQVASQRADRERLQHRSHAMEGNDTDGQFTEEVANAFAKPESNDAPRNATVKYRFGVGAFVESLLKIAFTYLQSYGNSVQKGTSAKARTMWLLAYLHCVFDHLKQSHQRRAPSPCASNTKSRLEKALNRIDKDMWSSLHISSMPAERISTPPAAPLAIGRKLSQAKCNSSLGEKKTIQRKNSHEREVIMPGVVNAAELAESLSGHAGEQPQKGSISLDSNGAIDATSDSVNKRISPAQGSTVPFSRPLKIDTGVNKERVPKIDDVLQKSPLCCLLESPLVPTRLDDQRDLDDAHGVERTALTPPPLGDLGEQLRSRLDGMLRHKEENQDDDSFDKKSEHSDS
eukprot:gnl/MRDRNA2_/MRDRNA2_195352_c0_seq1.p1 gnl/MRDRNA2_/MRDRNA2_195352_c0~~gnl/MRDRNA2_/MRDRNA2_195352_c0_seq1.p1  ORF type:complete len:482 (-),score=104.49 gnl/MRDRNA2_/MRDRNA2_195352_c0_seq1:110-1420(-)